MSNTPHQISIRMDADDRLVAAIGGAARYLADAAGLATEVILQFQAAVLSACRHCFKCHSPEQPCDITLRRSSDRLEVEVTMPGTDANSDSKLTWAGIDEVHCESQDHSAVLRLTKFVPPPSAESVQT